MENEISFAQRLSAWAQSQPDKIAFAFLASDGSTADELNYAQLLDRVCAVAWQLHSHNLSNKRVLLALPPGLDFVVSFYACLMVGAVAVPIPSTPGRQTERRVKSIIGDARASAILTTTHGSGHLLHLIPEDQHKIPQLFIDMVPRNDQPYTPHQQVDDVAFIQYTSGSIGAPKGVLITQKNLLRNCEMIREAFGHSDGLVGVGWLPLFHDMGLIGHVLEPVFVGGTSVLMSPLGFIQRPVRWLEAISKWKATTSGAPSYGYELCLRAVRDDALGGLDLSSWAVAYCGSEPVRASVLERFAENFKSHGFCRSALLPCYGLAEATLMVTSKGHREGMQLKAPSNQLVVSSLSRDVVSCGRPWGGSSVTITDPDSDKLLPDGQIGEICVVGDHVALGYWSGGVDARTLPFHSKLRTGDLGFMSEGELYVLGRIKDTLIVLGRKHLAEDIEATIAEAHPAFMNAPSAVFALELGDRESVVALQEVGSGSLRANDAADAMTAARAAVLGEHGLRIEDFLLVRTRALPRTSSGKVQRSESKRLYRENAFRPLYDNGDVGS